MSKTDLRTTFVIFYLVMTVILALILGILQFFTSAPVGFLLYLIASLAAWSFVLDDTDYDNLSLDGDDPADNVYGNPGVTVSEFVQSFQGNVNQMPPSLKDE
jgi:hypothetical protein